MNAGEISNKFIKAVRWSIVTEIAAKIVTPVTNMILARILAPEAFGVVATVTMVITFAEMFTDAGFHKYLVQHEFVDEEEKVKNANVAFWTNFGIAIFLWLLILIFCEQIASLVGNPGFGHVIAIACVQLPITSFSSIQTALYRRDFDFKKLFLVRLVSVCIPFVVTIPLALLGMSYFALIIGSIFMQIANATILMVKSRWKPHLFYDIKILKEMLSFSIWSLIESISIWFTSWADILIISNLLNQYFLGIYKVSTALVNSLMSLITAAIVPVHFSALSSLQSDTEKFNLLYLTTHRLVSILIFPLGLGIYLHSDLATQILLGKGWEEASQVIGIWAVTSALVIVFSHFSSEVYRAKGRPKLSVLAQFLHLIALVPVCLISSSYGFWILVYARAWIRLESIVVNMLIMKFLVGIPVGKIVKNVFPTGLSALLMGFLGYLLQQYSRSPSWSFASILFCALFYFGLLFVFPGLREDLNKLALRIRSSFCSINSQKVVGK